MEQHRTLQEEDTTKPSFQKGLDRRREEDDIVDVRLDAGVRQEAAVPKLQGSVPRAWPSLR
eukprot:2884755-Prorocentrum_lima.AAC.1